MKVQVSSLNGHDWSDYHEKIIHAAQEARSATPASVYATVLAVIKSNQWPSSIYERQCLTQWQLCMGQRLQALREATSRARDSEVPRAATTQPHELQRAVENGKTTAREKNVERVGEMGEMPHGKVDEEVAAATGPGMKTTEHHRTDSVSLATPVSGPQVNQKVELDLIKPPPPPSLAMSTTPPVRTAPHANESRRNGQEVVERDDNNEVRRAHERTEPTTPASTHTAPRCDANVGARDGVRAQRRGARRRRRGTREGSGGDAEPRERPDTAKPGAPRGPGTHLHHPTAATTWSVSRSHPGEDAGTRNSPPLSEDPADTTDDEKHCPDGPPDPPDQRMGTRRRGGKLRVESEVSRSSRADGSGTGNSSVEAHRPGKPDEQPDKVERSAMCRNALIEGERLGGSALAQQGRSTRTDEETDQRTSTSDDDIPRAPPEPPPSFTSPDEPTQR